MSEEIDFFLEFSWFVSLVNNHGMSKKSFKVQLGEICHLDIWEIYIYKKIN